MTQDPPDDGDDALARPDPNLVRRSGQGTGAFADLGLVSVGTGNLRKLLQGLHRGTLTCPLTPAGLAGHGLQDASGDLLAQLRGLDTAGVRAVVVAVLAERLAQGQRDASRG